MPASGEDGCLLPRSRNSDATFRKGSPQRQRCDYDNQLDWDPFKNGWQTLCMLFTIRCSLWLLMLLQSCLVLHKATYLSALSCLCTDSPSPDNDKGGQFSTFQPSAQLIGNTALGLGRRNTSSRREDLTKAAASVALAAEAWTKMRGTGRRVGPSRKVLPGVSLSSLSDSAWMAIKELWWRQILLSRGRRAGERGSSSLQVVQEFRKWSAMRSVGLNTPAQHRSQWKNTFCR